MRNASTAEWILCRLTSRERAASMIGDLVEIGERRGTLWFCLSLAGVAFSLVWRRPLAFAAALYAGAWTFGEFINTADTIYVRHFRRAYGIAHSDLLSSPEVRSGPRPSMQSSAMAP